MIKKILFTIFAVLIIFEIPNLTAQATAQKKTGTKILNPSLSVTHHTIQIDGKPLKYTATTGYMLLKDEKEKPKANVFFVAYTKDGVKDKSLRPVTFAFNGGPGSSSVWLHLGALGPRKVLLSDKGFPLAKPFRLVDNEYSILDVTDVVMVDPVSTGYSRAVKGVNPKEFHGFNEDIESTGEFIRLYIAKYERWASPKFLLGESYATTRSAGLSGFLQGRRHGMYLNGIILVSSVLNWQTLRFHRGNDLPYIVFLPTYTATAWYHKKLSQDLQKSDLRDVLAEAEQFALEEYSLALIKGNTLPEDEKKDIIQKLARYTGLSPKYVEQTNMRITLYRFAKELLRDEGYTVGRLDSRFKGKDADSAGEGYEFDPSNAAIYGPFAATLNHYLRSELKYKNDIPYAISGNVRPWNFRNVENRYLNVAETLRQAMSQNQFLKVFVTNGYYDGATPYFATEYTFSHLDLNNEFKGRIKMGYYEAGHMMYIRKASHAKFKKDIADFILSAIGD